MQEIITPPLVAGVTRGNLADVPRRQAAEHPNRVTFARPAGAGWLDITSAEFLKDVRQAAKGLVAAGLEAGDRIGIMSRTRYEWAVLDFAAWTAGCVPVPVYETSSPSQVAWILGDSGARAVVVELPSHATVVDQARADLPGLEQVWGIEDGGLEALIDGGEHVSDEALDARTRDIGPDDLATIIYTSGTTGRPKGCELTHGNFLDLGANAAAALPQIVLAEGASVLFFLPLAHVFARMLQITVIMAGMRVGHSPDIKNLLPDLQSFRPTFLLAVPRVFEKIYNATDQRLALEGKGRVFRTATRTAVAYSRALDAPGGPSRRLRLQHRFFDALVYRKMRAAMGGQVAWSISGGAPLGARLGHFFRGVGVTILEGYGLTETTAPTNVCTPALTRMGTVGPPLPGVGIRIAEDGEVLASGVGIFSRYRGNPEATQAAFVDGRWYRTGDLGHLDEDGCLTITGRKKEIIVTAGGKNVAPAALEDVIRAHPLVSQCLVVGDQRPFIGALITLDAEMVPSWGKAHDRPDLTPQSAVTDPYVREHLQMAVDRANRTVSRAESIREFVVLPGDFTEENGYLTPSLKLKRNLIQTGYAATIDRLYGGPVQAGPEDEDGRARAS